MKGKKKKSWGPAGQEQNRTEQYDDGDSFISEPLDNLCLLHYDLCPSCYQFGGYPFINSVTAGPNKGYGTVIPPSENEIRAAHLVARASLRECTVWIRYLLHCNSLDHELCFATIYMRFGCCRWYPSWEVEPLMEVA